jgi:raffinose/stachyose/melibiose transport system substrate-binding protein
MRKNAEMIVLILFVLMICFVATGCQGSNKTNRSTGSDVKKITFFSEQYDDFEMEGVRKYMIEPLKEAFPDIELDWQTSGEHNEVLGVQMAAGQGPDMFLLDGPSVTIQFKAASRVLDLTPYASQYKWDEHIFDWAIDSCTIDGKIYSLPMSYEGIVWWYNETMFKENNWRLPANRQEFEAFCRENMNKGLIPMAFGASEPKYANDWVMVQYMAALCSTKQTADVLLGKAKWTENPMRKAFAQIVEDWQAGWMGSTQSITQDDATSLFFDRSSATSPRGTWLYADIFAQMNVEGNKDVYTLGLFPSFIPDEEPQFPLGIGAVYAGNSNTRYPDEVAKILNFWMVDNIKNHAKHIEFYGWQPQPVSIPAEYFSPNAPPLLLQMMKVMDDAIVEGNINFAAYTFWPPQTRNYHNDNIEKVYLKIMTLDDFLKGLQATFDEAVSRRELMPIPSND